MFIVVEAVKRLRDIHNMSGHDGRFIFFACFDDDLRQLVDQLRERVSAFSGDIGRIDRAARLADRFFSGVPENACRSRVGVLYIRSGFAVEIQHLIPGEHIVLDPVVGKLIEYYRADTDLLGRFFDIVRRDALFTNDIACLRDGSVEYLFQEYHAALSG